MKDTVKEGEEYDEEEYSYLTDKYGLRRRSLAHIMFNTSRKLRVWWIDQNPCKIICYSCYARDHISAHVP